MPATRPRIVPSHTLGERLTLKANTGLILVCAPAGYGKTTLLTEWSRSLLQRESPWPGMRWTRAIMIPSPSVLIWLPVWHMRSVLSRAARISQLLRSSPEMDWQRILPAIINAVASIDRECVLILDDYHVISAPAIHRAWPFCWSIFPRTCTWSSAVAPIRRCPGSAAGPPAIARTARRRPALHRR